MTLKVIDAQSQGGHRAEAEARSGWLWVALACIGAAFLIHAIALDYAVDDAYITFQYVKNLLQGNGLVYNAGERVEGYTNFLWTLLLSGVAWAAPSGSHFLPLARTLGMIWASLTILAAFRFSTTHADLAGRPYPAFALVAPLLLAANAPFAAWAMGGLETAMFALLVCCASYCYLSQELWAFAPALLALASMTRAEGLLFTGIISCHLLVTQLASGKGVWNRTILRWALTFAAIYVPFYLWRFSYYGYAWPNVFYAKVGSGMDQYVRGLRYVREYLFSYGGVFLVLPLPFLWSRLREKWLQVLLPQVVIYDAYVVYVGGDGLAFMRFWVPIAPFTFLLVQEGLRGVWTWTSALRSPAVGRSAVALVFAAAAGRSAAPSVGTILGADPYRWRETQSGIVFPGDGTQHSYLSFDKYFIARQRLAAEWLDRNVAPNSLVASTPAGAIAYHSHLPVLDMLGLNDIHIAHNGHKGAGWSRAGHEKGDGKYVLSRNPDYILLGNVAVLPMPLDDSEMQKKLIRTSEHEIWADPTFHERYERVTVELAGQGIFRYFTFYKKKGLSFVNTRVTEETRASRAGSGAPGLGLRREQR